MEHTRVNDRLTIRLGSLAQPLADYCIAHEIEQSKAVRRIIAQALGVAEPREYRGNESFGEQGSKGAAARWAKRRRA